MKKLILSGLFALLTTGAIAQGVASPEITTNAPSAKYERSAIWQGQKYDLTKKEVKEGGIYQTTITFYTDEKVTSQFSATEIANFPIAMGSKSHKGETEPDLQYDLSYAIVPFEDYDGGVLFRGIIYVSKANPATPEVRSIIKDHNNTSLVPLGREIVLGKWGNEEMRVLVKKIK